MSRKKICIIIGLISFFWINTEAQNYHASNGSAYAGAIGLFNNPASGINAVYKWDLNLFSFQTTVTTNNISLSKQLNGANGISGKTKINFKFKRRIVYSFISVVTININIIFKYIF